MMRGWLAVLSVVAVTGVAGRVRAEGGDAGRLRALEEQLRAAQKHIKRLERTLEGHELGREPAPPPSDPDARPHKKKAVASGKTAGEQGPSSTPAPEPVELLLEALHKQGAIGDDDYRALKQAIASRRRADDAQRAEESKLLRERKQEAQLTRAEEKKGRFPVRVSYAFGKGLSFATEDGRFDGVLSNRFQLRYTFTDVHDDPTLDDESTFRIKRMKTLIQGHVYSPDLSYRVQVSFAPKVVLDDAYLTWQPRHYFGVQAGQFRVPFSRQQINSSGNLQFVDRAEPDDFFGLGRDIGVALTGRALGPQHDRLQWDLGIFNGNGVGKGVNENSDHLAAGRLLLMPLGAFDYYVESDVNDTQHPRIGFGGGGAFNSQAESTGKVGERAPFLEDNRIVRFFGTGLKDRFDVAQATGDVHFKFRGFSFLGEYYWAEADPNLLPSKSARGFNLQTGYFLIPRRLEAAFRYASISRDLDTPRSGIREIGGALGYFIMGHSLKVQLDVRDILAEDVRGPNRDTMEYRLQLNSIF